MKKLKVLTILVLLFFLPVLQAQAAEYKDIENHWGKQYMLELVERNIIAGYPDGTLKPDNNITIAEFVKILLTSQGTDPGNSASGFWADNYIRAAYETGYIKTARSTM
ncbi:MAG: S-layer homology domain-containing protein [Clostridiaceae bacterium]|jgi:hypothetical protein|nr:S-layer homology domain-containing protein [Clostridiaceae bacterium]